MAVAETRPSNGVLLAKTAMTLVDPHGAAGPRRVQQILLTAHLCVGA